MEMAPNTIQSNNNHNNNSKYGINNNNNNNTYLSDKGHNGNLPTQTQAYVCSDIYVWYLYTYIYIYIYIVLLFMHTPNTIYLCIHFLLKILTNTYNII